MLKIAGNSSPTESPTSNSSPTESLTLKQQPLQTPGLQQHNQHSCAIRTSGCLALTTPAPPAQPFTSASGPRSPRLLYIFCPTRNRPKQQHQQQQTHQRLTCDASPRSPRLLRISCRTKLKPNSIANLAAAAAAADPTNPALCLTCATSPKSPRLLYISLSWARLVPHTSHSADDTTLPPMLRSAPRAYSGAILPGSSNTAARSVPHSSGEKRGECCCGQRCDEEQSCLAAEEEPGAVKRVTQQLGREEI
jgi:hypothetical protein